jgi:hypothetical protein
MTQHDYSVSNQTFAATRSDINNAFSAILSQNSGSSAPVTTIAGMLWYDTTNGVIKQRNAADSGWNSLFSVGAAGFVTQNGASIYSTDTGTATAYAIAVSPVPLAYVEGMTFRFKPAHTNTGAASLNVNSLGAVSIRKHGSVALVANDLIAGQAIEVIFDGTNFQILSAGLPSQIVPIFTKFEQSSQKTISPGVLLTVPHSLGVIPIDVKSYLICQTTTEPGYSIGQRIPVANWGHYFVISGSPYPQGQRVWWDDTNIYARLAQPSSGTTVFSDLNGGDGTAASLTDTNWKLQYDIFA